MEELAYGVSSQEGSIGALPRDTAKMGLQAPSLEMSPYPHFPVIRRLLYIAFLTFLTYVVMGLFV